MSRNPLLFVFQCLALLLTWCVVLPVCTALCLPDLLFWKLTH